MFNLTPFHFNDFERSFLPEFFDEEFFSNHLAGFRTDIRDNGKEYLIEAELPGFNKDEIQVKAEANHLTISAQKHEMKEEKKDTYLHRERFSGRLFRSFSLDGIQSNGIKAEFKDGILKLSLPKKGDLESQSRTIDIQ